MPAFGALKSGWASVAGDFTPTLNTEDDPVTLKANESPACYGVNAELEDRLASGSCPTGTAYSAPAGTGSATSWAWLYNRLWYSTGSTLMWGAPWYRDIHFPHEVGSIDADTTIVAYYPVYGDSIIILTASGAHVISNTNSYGGVFNKTQIVPGFYATSGDGSTVLNNTPYVCNASGLFSYDGREIKEWSRKIRGSLGTFASKTLRIDASKQFVVLYSGTTATACLETETGKLFDYGTSGFLFTSRTLANVPGYAPFHWDNMAFSIEHANTSDGTITYQTKVDDGSWIDEPVLTIRASDTQRTRYEVPVQGGTARGGCKFAMRITALSSNVYIRAIDLCVQGLDERFFSK